MKASAPTLLLACLLTAPTTSGHAQNLVQKGELHIQDAWARASIGTSRPTAAFLTIRNLGKQADRLLDVRSPVAGRAEVHVTRMSEGIVRMSPAKDVIIEPGNIMTFAPGSYHIMLMKLQKPLNKGETTRLTLNFERAGKVTIDVPVLGPGAIRSITGN